MSYGVSGLDMFDINNGLIVGNLNGTIRKTINSGFSWVLKNKGDVYKNYDVQFINVKTGWVVGQYGKLLKTTDGGQNWLNQSLETSLNFTCVFFVDSLIGYVGTTDGKVLKTTNSGYDWLDTQTMLMNQIN